jgi:hypothetical protein
LFINNSLRGFYHYVDLSRANGLSETYSMNPGVHPDLLMSGLPDDALADIGFQE